MHAMIAKIELAIVDGGGFALGMVLVLLAVACSVRALLDGNWPDKMA